MTRSPTLMALLITFGLLSLVGKWPVSLVGVGMLGLAVWIGINRLRPKRPTVRPTVCKDRPRVGRGTTGRKGLLLDTLHHPKPQL